MLREDPELQLSEHAMPSRALRLHPLRGAAYAAAIAVVLVACLLAAPASSDNTPAARQIHVSAGESIQEALDRAQPGTEIVLSQGVWRESLTIRTPVSIVGDPGWGSILSAPLRLAPTIQIALAEPYSSGEVVIKDLCIQGAEERTTRSVPRQTGLEVLGNSRVQVTHCNISYNSGSGISTAGRCSVDIIDSDIRANGSQCAQPCCCHGAWFHGASQVRLVGTTVAFNSDVGLFATDHAQISVEACKINNNVQGIEAWDNVSVSVADCSIFDNRMNGLLL